MKIRKKEKKICLLHKSFIQYNKHTISAVVILSLIKEWRHWMYHKRGAQCLHLFFFFLIMKTMCFHLYYRHILHSYAFYCLCVVSLFSNWNFLVWQILDDPSPSPSKLNFSTEFCSFIDACLQKDADARPTAEQVSNWQKFVTWYMPILVNHKSVVLIVTIL